MATTADRRVTMRVNKVAFKQYATRSGLSIRQIAAEAGVSHTLIHQLLTDKHKLYVNMNTADQIEKAFDAPRGIIFLDELYGVKSDAERSA